MQAINKKALYNFILYEKIEAGLNLLGAEVKAIKQGRIDLSNSFVKIINQEAFLINAKIPVEGKRDYSPTRSRKLLLHKKEIVLLESKIRQRGLVLVPTKIYTLGNLIKIEIALAKPKKKYEKKEALKRRDLQKEIRKELKNKSRL